MHFLLFIMIYLIYNKINHTILSIDLKKCLQILIQIIEILLDLTFLNFFIIIFLM